MADYSRKRATTKKILDAALRMFARQGFETTSVDAVAQCAKVGHGTVFLHFCDKRQLHVEAIRLAADRFLQRMCERSTVARATFAAVFEAWVGDLASHNDASVLLLSTCRTDRRATVAAEAEFVNDRLVRFWHRHLEGWFGSRDGESERLRELAQLIVTVAPGFAAETRSEDPQRGISALLADFVVVVESMVPSCREANGAAGARERELCVRPRTRSRSQRRLDGDDLLSPRESEVLPQVERGCTNKEVASTLDITDHAVKFHLRNIYRKLSVGRRTEAVNVAKKLGVI